MFVIFSPTNTGRVSVNLSYNKMAATVRKRSVVAVARKNTILSPTPSTEPLNNWSNKVNQIRAVTAVSWGVMLDGMVLGYSSPALSSLHSDTSLTITDQDDSWMGEYIFIILYQRVLSPKHCTSFPFLFLYD